MIPCYPYCMDPQGATNQGVCVCVCVCVYVFCGCVLTHVSVGVYVVEGDDVKSHGQNTSIIHSNTL